MERVKKLSVQKILCIFAIFLIILYGVGIVWVNLNGSHWYNYDIYADAMAARYMAEDLTLFPDHWVFGNQLYVSATPVLAAVICVFTGDPFLSLGLASCVMTLGVLGSFLWCVRPFTGRKARIAGLLCMVGGTILGVNAATDTRGLQVFYTMASYYACYIIGILLTLGLWLRLKFEVRASRGLIGLCALLNLCLGMQSLRETLVLNLPLCAAALLLGLIERKSVKNVLFARDIWFCLGMLGANVLGVLLIRLLSVVLPINQVEVLRQASAGILKNIRFNLHNLISYMGLTMPNRSLYSILRFFCALFSATAVGYGLFHALRERCASALSCMILFCAVSLMGVFAAGVVLIETRPIYYFVWYILVALSFVVVLQNLSGRKRIGSAVLLGLILVSLWNGYLHFAGTVVSFNDRQVFYRQLCTQLHSEGITHLYYDEATLFECPRIGAFSGGALTCAPIRMNTGDSEDLLSPVEYLCSDRWYREDLGQHAYLVLSGKCLKMLQSTQAESYREALWEHLTPVHHASFQNSDYYFFSMDGDLFRDLIGSQ